MKENKKRCFGSAPGKEFYADYHDKEWGIPVHDDRLLFEMLILEGAQAGLSWETILKRREGYRIAFYHFDPVKVAKMTDNELNSLLDNQGIIRNRLKIYATRQNATAFLQIQKEFGSFSKYLWNFVNGKPVVTRRTSLQNIPASNPISDALSKDLKKRGMTFVGSTIIYAFMQAVGLVDDHLADCWCSLRQSGNSYTHNRLFAGQYQPAPIFRSCMYSLIFSLIAAFNFQNCYGLETKHEVNPLELSDYVTITITVPETHADIVRGHSFRQVKNNPII